MRVPRWSTSFSLQLLFSAGWCRGLVPSDYADGQSGAELQGEWQPSRLLPRRQEGFLFFSEAEPALIRFTRHAMDATISCVIVRSVKKASATAGESPGAPSGYG